MGGAPRIPGFSYIGPYAYFLTICTPDRIPWFANHEAARSIASQLSQNATDYGFDVVAYCVYIVANPLRAGICDTFGEPLLDRPAPRSDTNADATLKGSRYEPRATSHELPI